MTVTSFALAALAAAQTVTTFHQAPPAPAATVQPSQPTVQSEQAPSSSTAGVSTLAPPPVTQPAESIQVAPSAPSAPTGVVLWRNIENGMSVAQLRSLHPAAANVVYKDDRTIFGDVVIMEGCQAKVNVMHPEGFVKEIVMRGEGSIAGRCSLKLITALSGKYGEPMDKDKVKASLFGREGKNYIWSRDGVTLQLKRYTNGPLGGGGLFAASWELRYSANAQAIDL